MKTTIVHCKKSPYDVYIGRIPGTYQSYGNPFSHLEVSSAIMQTETVEEAVDKHLKWVMGELFRNLLPKQREYILTNIPNLSGKILGCWCGPGKPCHGHNFIKLIEDPAMYRRALVLNKIKM